MSDINLKGKSFLTLLDFTPEEIELTETLYCLWIAE